ncbi:MAG TPA: SulP family inorganic anion transporter [Planctomycetaceae bacterium]|jgi:SulP family sulfate permease|nr:SulP family inorganic anion transporter [Planctomycetaceae bacterium]
MARVLSDKPATKDPAASDGQASGSWREGFFRIVPAFDSLRTYSRRSLFLDTMAGLTVATVAVPQAMAYALAAGLKPEYGLYTAIVMTAVGALFDSSKQLINGPTNAISIAVLSALVAFPEADRVQLAVVLALLVGAVQLLITLLRLGDLNRYISHAVIVGFTLGAAVLIVLDQLKNLFGLPKIVTADEHFVFRFWHTISHIDQTHFPTLMVGLGTVAIALTLGFINRRLRFPLPALLIAVMGTAAIVWAFGLKELGVDVVGKIPAELPAFEVPKLDWAHVRALAGSSLAIALLGLLEAISMAKAIAAQTGQKLDINQQCLSEGLANLTGSLFHCYPGSGSLTRSTINQQAGAQTQWSGVISAGAVALIVVLFARFAYYIPRSGLAGILMVAAWRLVDKQQLAYHLKTTRSDAWIVCLTAIAAVAISVEFCILIGVFLSFLFYVPRAARIHMTELVLAPERVVRERITSDPQCGRIRIFSLEGEFFFGAAPELEDHFDRIAALTREGIRVVVLRVKRARNPDPVCLAVLERFIERMDKLGATVLLCGIRPDFMRIIEAGGLVRRLGPERVFTFQETGAVWSSTLEAIRFAYEVLKGDVCAICPRYAESLEGKEGWYYMI